MKNRTSPLRTFFLIRNLFFPFITLCLLTVNIPALAADSDKSFPEYRIRAAFIYNFLKFVTWPGLAPFSTGHNQLRVQTREIYL
jgi:hypothetical protein